MPECQALQAAITLRNGSVITRGGKAVLCKLDESAADKERIKCVVGPLECLKHIRLQAAGALHCGHKLPWACWDEGVLVPT